MPAPDFRPAKISVAAYHELVSVGFFDEGPEVELLQGYLVEKIGKNSRHSGVNEILYKSLLRKLPAGLGIRSQNPITLADSEPEPDICVFRGEDADFLDRHPLPSEVLLVVEVADTTARRDREWKRDIYAAAGIPLYWVVNLQTSETELYSDPELGLYRGLKVVRRAEKLECTLDGHALAIEPSEIWG